MGFLAINLIAYGNLQVGTRSYKWIDHEAYRELGVDGHPDIGSSVWIGIRISGLVAATSNVAYAYPLLSFL